MGPLKGNMPKFYMKPVTEFGDAVVGQEGNRLSDEGTLNCLRKSVGTWKNSGFPTYYQTLDLLILCSARITHTSMSRGNTIWFMWKRTTTTTTTIEITAWTTARASSSSAKAVFNAFSMALSYCKIEGKRKKRVVLYRVTIIFFTATGSTPLNLENKYISIDWRNYPRSPDFVDVDEKKDWVC